MATQNQTVQKILIAPDKFKGSLTSTQAAEAIRKGLEEKFLLPYKVTFSSVSSAEGGRSDASEHKSGGFCARSEGKESSVHNLHPFCARDDGSMVNELRDVATDEGLHPQFRIIEIADGGDGSLEVLQGKLPGSQVLPVQVHDPLGREVASQILVYRMPWAQNAHDMCPDTEITPVQAQKAPDLCTYAEKTPVQAQKAPDLCTYAEKTPVQAQKAPVSCPEQENSLMWAQNEHVLCQGEELEEEPWGEKCAFIEMAKVSGLEMLGQGERNPLHTSTYGMGEAIKAAITYGATQITLSIGGSATNDGGAGMLQALGYKFLDAAGEEIPAPICGGDLQRVAEIIALDNGNILRGITFKVICDVTNPLLGPQGATAVYGPQKGADAGALRQLEEGLANYASVAERCLGVQPNQKEHPGAGAAGGVGYAGLAFLEAELIPGWKFFAQITSLEESVQWADLVITGEGSLDSQSLSGKVVSGVLNLAAKYNKEVIIFCGVSKLTQAELENAAAALPQGLACYSIASLGHPLEVCMRDAAKLLRQLARECI